MSIIVRETWYLKNDYYEIALNVFQEMDKILGPEAHDHDGWCDHARFFQNNEFPEKVEVFYPWKSLKLHKALINEEKVILEDFEKKYFKKPRTFEYFTELPVEV
jgi:hypothetical protein